MFKICNDYNILPRYSHSRSLQRISSCDSQYGCCGSNITCATGQACEIDCTRGCRDAIIHAETASSLTIVGSVDGEKLGSNVVGVPVG